MNSLHCAAFQGSAEHTKAVLSRGVLSVDETTPDGMTPLMFASLKGHSHVLRILLNKRANVAVVDNAGYSALHMASQGGHQAVTKLLVNAGAPLEAKTSEAQRGQTSLHLAAHRGHSEVVGVLIEAGAKPDSRMLNGATPLFLAAEEGHLAATKVLLRAKADALLVVSRTPSGNPYAPLDVAAVHGHSEVVGELIQELGIEGCGGPSGGVRALEVAAFGHHVEVMGLLTAAGVVDTGQALYMAVGSGRESSVKFLLQQWEKNTSGVGARYLDTTYDIGRTPLACSIQTCRSRSPRIMRLLVDAGADTTTAVRLTDIQGRVVFNGTPLALAECNLALKSIDGEKATRSQLYTLEAIRRLLMRVEAVHAVSWLWTRDTSSITRSDAAAEAMGGATMATPTSLQTMLPLLRRRARRPRVLLAALSRFSIKP